ncbi:hypothetical protein FE784_06810 [Paenibacillus hemerocallicola]|uniref:Uncharacterized protein n=1 Tax=Paenibacillus hemerocallicola TaxID=1172614 RepID=A0A5C4TF13_9BACL|nr:hypothetical protein [Paenibacillus hemerocallicola]TNJ67246.1 hypothetical protein FE784_06810 [Paenibacillus hemerocallicola]
MWDRPSGSTRFRYKEPVEAAYELVEEVLKPFAAQLNKYRKLGMLVQTKKVGLGLAKGIIKFSRESETEFREFAPDDALEWLGGLVMEWETECTDEIEKQCIRDIKKLFHE